jgi:hypothetical protein
LFEWLSLERRSWKSDADGGAKLLAKHIEQHYLSTHTHTQNASKIFFPFLTLSVSHNFSRIKFTFESAGKPIREMFLATI